MHLRLATLVAAAFTLAAPAAPAAPVAPAQAPVATLSESAPVTPARFPNADTVVLSQEQRVEVNAEGGYVRRSTLRVKALTEKGRRELRSHDHGFNVAYGFAKATGLRLFKADGRTVTLDPAAQSAVQQDPSSMAVNIYDPNDKRLVVSVPGIEVGDTLEISMEEGEPKPRMKGGFADILTLEDVNPVLRSTYTVVTPKSLPLATVVLKGGDAKGLSHTKTEKADTIEYRWEIGETPQAMPEPGMPALHTCVRRLLVSTLPDWPSVSRWYWNLCEPHFAITHEIKAKADELVKGVDDREERLRAIFRFVSQEIRYMGITTETEAPGYEPHDVAMTFGKRYGVCRDKAALLTVMLRAAGFDAYPVLIMAGSRLDEEHPSPFFNHAITAVRESDGTFRLMDSTNESTKDIFPAYLANCSYLVADPKGEPLRVAPVPSADAHLLTGETRLSVRADGSVSGVSVLDFGGINDTYYRGGLAQAKPDDIRRFVQNRLSALMPGARVESLSLEPENLLDTTRPLRLRVAYTAPEFLADREGKALLRTPYLALTLGFAVQELSSATGLEKRRFPLKLDIIAGVRERVSVDLPPNVGETLALPEDLVVDDANLAMRRSMRREGATLTGEVDLRMKRLDIPAADYPALRSAVREMARAGKRAALLSTDAAVKPDSRVLSRKVTLTAADAHSISVRVEERRSILTYAGKKDNAEIKLSWNTRNPEPVLERAVVTDAAGNRHEVNPTEINVLDASWVASAPRYAPERVKVVALPNVEEGSLIDLAYTQTFRNLPALSWSCAFASSDAVDAESVELVAPASLPLYLDNRAGATVTRQGDLVRIGVSRRTPPSPRESGAAPAPFWAPTLGVSSVATDADYAAAMRAPLAGKADPDAAVRAKAAALTADLASDSDKVRALRDFVAKNIRQAGPAWGGVSAADTSGAARTLADGYGSVADRHLLFVALLRAAGYDATPALFCTDPLTAATRHAGESRPGEFYDTIGTRLRLPSGDAVDFTRLNQYADWRVGAADGTPVLPLDTGKPALVKSAADRIESEFHIRLDANGDASVACERRQYGERAADFTGWVSEITPEDRARYHQEIITGLSRDARPSGPLTLEKGSVARIAYAAQVADFAVVQNRFAYFDLPHAQSEVFPGAVDAARRLPYAVGAPADTRTTWTIDLPRGWKLAGDPVRLDWQGPSGVGRVRLALNETVNADGTRRLVWTKTLALRPAVVSPEAYPALVEINRRMKSSDTWRVLLERE